jgi:hypothetical protein
MQPVTVERLLKLLQEQVKKGNGQKKILLSNDDEGNGYHTMYYEITEDVAGNDMWGEIENPNDYVILG